MRLENIFNDGKTNDIIVFSREDNGELKANKFNNFYSYYYEKSSDGNFKSYFGDNLRKTFCSSPKEKHKAVKGNRNVLFNGDLRATTQFIIDKVDVIDKAPIRSLFYDIETKSKTMPNAKVAPDPISCITTYDTFNKECKTWWLPEWESEYQMLKDFIFYIRKVKPGLLLGWNSSGGDRSFDFPYLVNRTAPMFPDKDFASMISPIGKNRYGYKDESEEIVYYPAGISVLDYMELYKKLTLNREKNYTLDYIAQTRLGAEPNKKVDFSILSEDIKEKNRNDVLKLSQLDEQKHIIEYFDNIRRICKVEFENLLHNSRCVDSLVLAEAKIKNVAVPMQPVKSDIPVDEEDEIKFEGAYRKLIEGGLHTGKVWEVDISSAYPFAIINFCLDPANAFDTEKPNSIKIDNTYFVQNQNAIIPSVVKKLMTLKNSLSKKIKGLHAGTEEYEYAEIEYAASKGLTNSCFGILGYSSFRLFDPRVAGAITFIVRSLLHYIEEKLTSIGCKVIYLDTDGIKLCSDIDRTEQINQWAKEWAKETFNKENIDITFENKGYYEGLFIVALCRYIGRLRLPNGELKEEIKGIQAKRVDTTAYCKRVQPILLNKILDGESKEDICSWVKNEIDNFKELPLIDIAMPCKINVNKVYTNVPIFVRALKNTPELSLPIGEPFYYIYLNGTDIDKKDNVKAFTEENFAHINKEQINYTRMLDRNLINMLTTIFEALKWDIKDVYFAPEKPKRVKKEKKVPINTPKIEQNKPVEPTLEIKPIADTQKPINIVKDDIFD